jgi:hypothetical protein
VRVSSASGTFAAVVVVGDDTVVVAPATVGVGHVNVVCAVDVCPNEPKLLGVCEADDGCIVLAPMVHNESDVSMHGAIGDM